MYPIHCILKSFLLRMTLHFMVTLLCGMNISACGSPAKMLKTIVETHNRCDNMPSMVTEFGLCEPHFKGGDERRMQILLERIPIYKSLPNMVGYVWFSLNDYRTPLR